MKALIVHTRRTGLGLIRSLGKKGIAVYAADEYKSPGFYSRHVRKYFVTPNVIDSGEQYFVDSMLRIGREIGSDEKAFLFTSSDEYLLIFSKYWSLLSQYYISISETNESKLLDSLTKDRMYKTAERSAVKYPKTYYSDNFDIDEIIYPVVIKPSIRKTSDSDIGKALFKIRKCETLDDLKNAVSILKNGNSSFVVQEFIDGADDQLYTVGLFAYKGKVVAAASARKIRQFPPTTGECSFGELVYAPDVIEEANKYINEAGITGMCQLEFKKHSNRYYLMEINPRPWSWNSLIEYSGVNLPYIACTTLKQPNTQKRYKQTRYKGTWVFSLMDLKYHIILNKNISILDFIRNLLFSNRHAYWDAKDPMPLVVAIFQFLNKPSRALQIRST